MVRRAGALGRLRRSSTASPSSSPASRTGGAASRRRACRSSATTSSRRSARPSSTASSPASSRDRGVKLERTHQLNVGGNTDFMNMLERERLESKKISKTNAVTSQLDYDIGARNVHIGPCDYVQWLDDRKWAYIRMEGRCFGDVPLNIELKLEVVDSPNSAGIVIDAVRCAKLGARQRPRRRARVAVGLLHEVAAGAAPRRPVPRRGRARSSPKHGPKPAKKARKEPAPRPDGPRWTRSSSAWRLPFALAGAHPVAEHVRGVATALAAARPPRDGARTEPSTRALRSGRRRLRALAGGDDEALIALDGEPLQVAVAPAVPLRQRGRRRGAGLPVARQRQRRAGRAARAASTSSTRTSRCCPASPRRPSRHSPGLTVATFHSTRPGAALPGPRSGPLERYRARIDALLATSAGGGRAGGGRSTPASTRSIPEGIGTAFTARRQGRHARSRPNGTARAGRRCARSSSWSPRPPDLELVLLWNRRSRRPLRPYVPAQARGRVHATSPEDAAERAAVAAPTPTCSSPAPGGDPALAWEARACGCAVVSPLPAGSLEPQRPGLGFAADQPALAAAAAARLLDDGALRDGVASREPAAAERAQFAAVAGSSRRSTPASASAAGGTSAGRRCATARPISADLHMHTNHSHDCATDPEALARPLHRRRASARSRSPTTTRCRARWRPRGAGQADHGHRRRGGQDLAGRGDRPLPARADRARA